MDKNRYNIKPFIWSSHTIIAQMLKDENTDSILDVGSDKGFLGQSLTYNNEVVASSAYKPRDLWAIDKRNFSMPAMYSCFWKEDLNRTEFSFLRSKTFQAIVLADVVEHLRSPDRVVSKLIGHLEKGGFFIFSFPNMGFFLVRILTFFGIRPKMERGPYDRTHLHDFDIKTAEQFLKKLRLGVLEFRVTPMPLPLFSKLFKERSPLFFLYKTMNFLAQKFPNLFAYQLIFRAKINEV